MTFFQFKHWLGGGSPRSSSVTGLLSMTSFSNKSKAQSFQQSQQSDQRIGFPEVMDSLACFNSAVNTNYSFCLRLSIPNSFNLQESKRPSMKGGIVLWGRGRNFLQYTKNPQLKKFILADLKYQQSFLSDGPRVMKFLETSGGLLSSTWLLSQPCCDQR